MTLDEAKKAAYRRIHDFNFANPQGSPVFAWPGLRTDKPLVTRTRSSAWVLPAGDAVVMVDGHAGGISLDHIEPDHSRQPAVTDIDFPTPPCPLCGDALEYDGDTFACIACRASWNSHGADGCWDEPSAHRCPAMRSWDHRDLPDDQCVLAELHDGDHRTRDGLGCWDDDAPHAVIDGHGQPHVAPDLGLAITANGQGAPVITRECPTGCGRAVRAGHLMCAGCWRQVPRELQQAVYRAWRAWRRDLGSAELMQAHKDAADAAIGSVP